MVHFAAVVKRKRGPIPIEEHKPKLWDFQVFLYSIWLEKLALSPGFYDDARESHLSGLCKCGCTRAFTLEVRKKK